VNPVLVDTSVLRRYFSGISSFRQLGEFLDEDGAVLILPFILGEFFI
jgi:hypothetical protein